MTEAPQPAVWFNPNWQELSCARLDDDLRYAAPQTPWLASWARHGLKRRGRAQRRGWKAAVRPSPAIERRLKRNAAGRGTRVKRSLSRTKTASCPVIVTVDA